MFSRRLQSIGEELFYTTIRIASSFLKSWAVVDQVPHSPLLSPPQIHIHTHTLKWEFLKVKRDSFYFFLFELHPQPHVHNRILIKIRFSKIFWEIPEKIRMEWAKDKYFLDLWEDNIRKYHIMWFNEDSWKKYIIKIWKLKIMDLKNLSLFVCM